VLLPRASFHAAQKRLSGGMTDTTSTALPRTLSPSLFLFTIIYGGMVVLAGVLGNKQVALFGGWQSRPGFFRS